LRPKEKLSNTVPAFWCEADVALLMYVAHPGTHILWILDVFVWECNRTADGFPFCALKFTDM